MNWNYMDRVLGSAKYFSLIFILFIIFLNFAMGFANPIIDNFGHLGGLICGFFLIFIMHGPNEPDDGMCCKYTFWYWISIGVLSFIVFGGLIIFYTVRIV